MERTQSLSFKLKAIELNIDDVLLFSVYYIFETEHFLPWQKSIGTISLRRTPNNA
jgi:hypothetical protein